MMTLGAIAFAAPWALAALAALPAIWWLLRLTPPAPLRMVFPPLRILIGLSPREETAAQSPLWLILMRLMLAVAVILGLSNPILNVARELRGTGPILVVIDDGWAAARDWPGRQAALGEILDQAAMGDRPVAVVTTAPAAKHKEIELLRPEDARDHVRAIRPKPWRVDRADALARIQTSSALSASPPGDVIWLTDGVTEPDTEEWLDGLRRIAPVRVVRDPPGRALVQLRPPTSDGAVLKVEAVRSTDEGRQNLWLRAFGADGLVLARQPIEFADGKGVAEGRFDLPTEIRNRLVRLDIEGQGTAAATVLMDERWRRRPVGLLSGPREDAAQPLLGEFYYVQRALAPFTEVRRGATSQLLARKLAVLVMADDSPMNKEDPEKLARWIDAGGVLVRFAGPRLSDTAGLMTGEQLLPVPLRAGGRTLGGALSWDKPARLAPFSPDSPFAGLSTPEEVTISRQVLARPALDLAAKTWARLVDGTPLITADRRGKGWTVLFHVSANTAWSNLSISGLFVQMLRRVVALSHGSVSGSGDTVLAPMETLDGYALLGSPPPGATGIAASAFDRASPGPTHPPGFYGKGEERRALNLTDGTSGPVTLGSLPGGVEVATYGKARQLAFRPWLMGAALVLFVLDLAIALSLRGALRRRPMATAAIVLLIAQGFAGQADAQSAGMEASLHTRLAFVTTGDDRIDAISRAGLHGLGVVVNRRTAVELASPVAVDPETDELVFFPLIYWPVTDAPPPSDNAAAHIRAYLAGGGMILFDTRDPDGAVSLNALRQLAETLRIPPLIPTPTDHVLTRAYYLLRDFPGRWAGGTLWVERAGERVNDGVSPVIVGSNDWAGAWAIDETERPLFATVPGGERQREMAYRFGVNLVMYTLTGNYKADQVHLPAILERLGL